MKVWGITGTNGKTTTAWILAAFLDADPARKTGYVTTVEVYDGAQRFYTGYTTPPLAKLKEIYAAMEANGCTDCVMEVSSHAIHQNRTGDTVFAGGAFTNLSEDHLDYHKGVQGRVDIITGTFGKALGGASGGFTSGRKEIVQLLRQRSRPYLFSNTVAPAICATTLKVLEMLKKDNSLCKKVMDNAKYFRSEMEKNGFDLAGKDHAIVPVMLYDAVLSQKVAEKMLEKGIYVTGFFYPVVPKDKARIRTQMSAGHSKEDIDKCVKAFVECKNELGF